MSPLDIASFEDFYRDVHGWSPFPWQQDLVAHVLGTGAWPDVIDVPTGLGKTSLIDIGVYVAAATGCAPGGPGRRRLFFAIDRRIVVDEAFGHAYRLAGALNTERTGSSIVGDVARALDDTHRGASTAEPLVVTRMRGGITWSWRWLDRVDRPAVVVGTVDQLGSRLLFGGYGTGPRLRSIDAALTGTDSLLIIDEAHLAKPFVETTREVATSAMVGELVVGRPLVITMSATPDADGSKRVFPDALRDERDSAVAAQRLRAKKRLHGVNVPRNVDVVGVLAEYARRAFDPPSVAAVGVVCNTVARARAVADVLLHDPATATAVELLTGRIRPHDRETLVPRLLARAGIDRDRSTAQPIVLVATQTIEVGANLDLDALITESAPVDALVQRSGRLHRLGLPVDAERNAVVVHHEVEQALYGAARENTWLRLVEALPDVPTATQKRVPELGSSVDASPAALRDWVAALGDTSGLTVERPSTPTLLPEIVAEWAATSSGDGLAERALFLHGNRADNDDVSLVWRADLPATEDEWTASVDRMPPVADEQLDIPLGRVRRWLLDQPSAADIGDVASAATAAADEDADHADGLRSSVLQWRAPGDGQVLHSASDLRRLRPGDVVVVPAAIGGCDQWGWAPASCEPVIDLAESVPRRLVRVHPRTLTWWLGDHHADHAELSAALDELAIELDRASPDELDVIPTDLLERVAELRGGARLRDLIGQQVIQTYAIEPFGRGVDVEAPAGGGPEAVRAALTDSDVIGSSLSGGPVALADHHAAVAERAGEMATSLGLAPPICASVSLAAGFHDLGKCDPRFQVMLHAGDYLTSRAALDEGRPLAKSGLRPDDRQAARSAWRSSNLPRGYRHEAGSSQAVQELVESVGGIDAALVVHLVAAHHGYARPLLRAVDDDGAAFSVVGCDQAVDPARSVDFEHPARFRRLSERYGHWGLALLEAIVRLSDIGCSEEGT